MFKDAIFSFGRSTFNSFTIMNLGFAQSFIQDQKKDSHFDVSQCEKTICDQNFKSQINFSTVYPTTSVIIVQSTGRSPVQSFNINSTVLEYNMVLRSCAPQLRSILKKLAQSTILINNPSAIAIKNKYLIKITPNLKLLCNEHNTEIIMLDLSEKRNSENRLTCVYCIYELNVKYTAIKGAQQQWNEYKQQKNNEISKYEEQQKLKINQLKQIFQSLREVYKTTINNIFTYLDQILQEIESLTTQHTQEFNKDWNQYTRKQIIVIAETFSIVKTQGLQQLNIDKDLNEKEQAINKRIYDELLKLNEKLQQSNDKIKRIIEFYEILVNNEKQTQPDYIIQDQSNQIQVNLQDNECQTIIKESKDQIIQTDKQEVNESQIKQITEQQPANYKQLDQYTIQQNQLCYCLCFNKDKNILAVGCQYDIKIFKFENGKMTEIQLLKGHTYHVRALYIGNNNQIYSCSLDKTIKIWVYKSNQWIMHQSLEGHTNEVLCITMNKEEDQFITGSCDKSIKCWMKTQDQWKCVQTLQHHSHYVVSLSQNESQIQLLSCGFDKKLNVFKCDSNKQWSLTQAITADDQVYRASFINDNIIVYQLMIKGILKVYEYNQTEFKQKQDIKVKGSGTVNNKVYY